MITFRTMFTVTRKTAFPIFSRLMSPPEDLREDALTPARELLLHLAEEVAGADAGHERSEIEEGDPCGAGILQGVGRLVALLLGGLWGRGRRSFAR
jgi:hypothetical protein